MSLCLSGEGGGRVFCPQLHQTFLNPLSVLQALVNIFGCLSRSGLAGFLGELQIFPQVVPVGVK